MNNDQIVGKFAQFKGRALRAWAELTNNQDQKTEGTATKVYGLVREKVGDAKEVINDSVNKLHVD
jgi:uncharacterized protein YjbJ (UPF0337 family)